MTCGYSTCICFVISNGQPTLFIGHSRALHATMYSRNMLQSIQEICYSVFKKKVTLEFSFRRNLYHLYSSKRQVWHFPSSFEAKKTLDSSTQQKIQIKDKHHLQNNNPRLLKISFHTSNRRKLQSLVDFLTKFS